MGQRGYSPPPPSARDRKDSSQHTCREEHGAIITPTTRGGTLKQAMNTPEQYLSVDQLAKRIPYSPKTIRNLMCRGVFLEGVHFTRLTGRPIFLWSKVEELLQAGRREGHRSTGKRTLEDDTAIQVTRY